MAAPVHPYSDYGVALRTLKSARSWLGLLLLLCVAAQFLGFALMYWTQQPYGEMKAQWTWLDEGRARMRARTEGHPAGTQAAMGAMTTGAGTTVAVATAPSPPEEPFVPRTALSKKLNIRDQWAATYTMAVPVTQILGLMAAVSQTIIVFLTLLVILVAQAPGVAHVTRSLIWMVLLLFMVLPWQSFAHDFPAPGILYGYPELQERIGPIVAPTEAVSRYQWFLVHARFMFWPGLGMLVLLIGSERFRAGIMLAIGHPLQSMMQPRTGMGGMAGAMGAPKPAPTINPFGGKGGGAGGGEKVEKKGTVTS